MRSRQRKCEGLERPGRSLSHGSCVYAKGWAQGQEDRATASAPREVVGDSAQLRLGNEAAAARRARARRAALRRAVLLMSLQASPLTPRESTDHHYFVTLRPAARLRTRPVRAWRITRVHHAAVQSTYNATRSTEACLSPAHALRIMESLSDLLKGIRYFSRPILVVRKRTVWSKYRQ